MDLRVLASLREMLCWMRGIRASRPSVMWMLLVIPEERRPSATAMLEVDSSGGDKRIIL